MTTLLAFVFVLGVLVFVHELGHFLAAKRVGIRVLKFQLGFNPTLVSFRRGDTEYGIGALPLGGYVKMAGENHEDVARDEHGNVVTRSDEFLSKTKWERFQVLIMGPVMNILLALVLTAVVLYQGVEKSSYEDQPVVVGVVAAGSPAAKADIQPGDRIVSVAGRGVDTWDQFLMAIGSKANREVSIGLLRSGLEQTRKMTPAVVGQSRFEFGDIGVLPNVHPHVGAVSEGSPAEKAGLKNDDVVLAVDDQPITFQYQLKAAISKHPDQAIALTILRNGEKQTIRATPARQGNEGLLGIRIADDTVKNKPGFGQAISLSVEKNIEYATADLPDARRPDHAGNIAEAADGAHRNRAVVRRIGSAGLDRAHDADGVDQPEPRAVEPVADPGARRRAHLHHGARRAGAPRLQPGRQREDADGRFCGHPDVDGDSHL